MLRFLGLFLCGALVASVGHAESPITPIAPPAPLPTYLKGAHLSGGGYNPGPGKRYGYDYIYPSNADLDYFKSKGFSLIRLETDIGRLQPVNLQPLAKSEIDLITPIIEHARAIGMFVVLDPHNYGEMWCSTATPPDYEVIGTSACTTNAVFADFWTRFSTLYSLYPNIMLGLMNEPFIQTAVQWKTSAVAAINAIRVADKTQTILIPGTFWSEGLAWVTSGNAAAWAGYTDPAGGPFMFEAHQYLNDNTTTRPTACVTGFGTSLSAMTSWLKANSFQGFIGEWGYPAIHGVTSSTCQTVAGNFMASMALNASQWTGWDWCCSGPWAGNNNFNLYVGGNGIQLDQPQTPAIMNYSPL